MHRIVKHFRYFHQLKLSNHQKGVKIFFDRINKQIDRQQSYDQLSVLLYPARSGVGRGNLRT